MAGSGIRVTVEDLATGEQEQQEIPADDYMIICAGSCHVAGATEHANGTQQLTIKGRHGTGMSVTVRKGQS